MSTHFKLFKKWVTLLKLHNQWDSIWHNTVVFETSVMIFWWYCVFLNVWVCFFMKQYKKSIWLVQVMKKFRNIWKSIEVTIFFRIVHSYMLIFYLQCFYTMAWTTVKLNNNRKEKTNLLAVAGNTEKRKKLFLKFSWIGWWP